MFNYIQKTTLFCLIFSTCLYNLYGNTRRSEINIQNIINDQVQYTSIMSTQRRPVGYVIDYYMEKIENHYAFAKYRIDIGESEQSALNRLYYDTQLELYQMLKSIDETLCGIEFAIWATNIMSAVDVRLDLKRKMPNNVWLPLSLLYPRHQYIKRHFAGCVVDYHLNKFDNYIKNDVCFKIILGGDIEAIGNELQLTSKQMTIELFDILSQAVNYEILMLHKKYFGK